MFMYTVYLNILHHGGIEVAQQCQHQPNMSCQKEQQ